MPGGKERILKRRIASVKSTKKITRAMELIAATRVVKAMQRANQARPYASRMTSAIEDLAAGGAGLNHPLLRTADEVSAVGFVVITSDRGLAGPYNSSVIKAAEREIMAAQTEGKGYRLILIGKKARDYFTFRNYEVEAFFEGMTDTPSYDDAKKVALQVAEMFTDGACDQVILAYQEFISMGTQEVAVRQFLPLESLGTMAAEGSGSETGRAGYSFEPSPEGVLESLLPRYVESRLFSALLDASASEHANRQRAMKAATDNADELITKLSRELSRARQDAITTEIMEIVSGAEALGGDAEIDDAIDGSVDVDFDSIVAGLTAAPDVSSASAARASAGPYGAGSHAPMPDNSRPQGFTIKGNDDSMLYHRPDSRSYKVTIAEVWFDTPERAEAAGFRLAGTHPKNT
ncbi:F0F1 ATP synthase subunit gamma [Acidimicrobiaceae bacterium AH-315-P05]|nr:F0F1 ATP synthase subunit gamma [Acidimicrobiaceae bacterium AH-315-P05]